ncbi:MAG: 1-acyl-sn-glycerol-3-phosphate acyltransferase [Rickettsiales bacterium]|jgi:1-acyl-sn-glycerol-3-phosphate acyltransferase|nr:1-acyl-sn-glycerol-3-phosphate acyltransferase [Rickettsiales bacterium]
MKKTFLSLIGFARFFCFWIWAVFNAILALFNPGGKIGNAQFRFLMRGLCVISGIRVRVRGELSKARPLLLVGNHISDYEFAVLPAALGANFFGKSEIAKMPFVGWISKKLGVQFISRDPRTAAEATRNIREYTAQADWPMVIFPEGTSTNGAYVHPFKSALFSMVEPQINGDPDAVQFTIQPFVMYFRDYRGRKLSERTMAEDYASFDSKKMLQGPNDVKMRGDFVQVLHMMKLGGITVEIELLPPPPLAGIKDRKELASMLHEIISTKYMKNK